jgi:2-haloacid dehalogenase
MSATRRQFLQAASVTMAGTMGMPSTPLLAAQQPASRIARDLAGGGTVKALVFDTFGTVVDYRSTIISEGEALGKARGLAVDWAKFADAWRGAYAPAMDRVRKGELPWTKLDALHRMMLDKVLADFGVKGLSEADIDNLNRVWHRLKPWPDAVSGLTRLKKKFIIAPLSNGNVSLMTDMAKHAGLPWDLILGAELARHYKPDKEVYLTGAELLSLAPHDMMMVAAHQNDLRAAHALGFRTAFVPRPQEGPNGERNFTPDPVFDVVAPDFNALASAMGA